MKSCGRATRPAEKRRPYLNSARTAFGFCRWGTSGLLCFGQTPLTGFEKRVSNGLFLCRVESRLERTSSLGKEPPIELFRDLSGVTNRLSEGFEFGCGDLPRESGGNVDERIGHQQRLGWCRCHDGSGCRRHYGDLRFTREERREIVRTPLVSRIGFLKQEQRLASPAGADSKKVHTNAKLLRLLDPDAQVLVAGQEHRLAHRMVARQRNHVGNDQRVHTLLFTHAVNEAETNLDAREVRGNR